MLVYPCPCCGATGDRRGQPFTDPSQTRGHINGATDDNHPTASVAPDLQATTETPDQFLRRFNDRLDVIEYKLNR